MSNRIALSNKIIGLIQNELINDELGVQKIPADKVLKAVYKKQSPSLDLDKRIEEITPYTRLVQSELFTGGRAGIDLGSEIGKEILSADRIDFLVSFIKWKGIRIFEQQLQQFVGRGGKIRFITTTYMGASEAKAVEFLSNLPNSEVKVSYNTGNERLHAKAYLFYRRTGFHTAYIGSSNFSRSALTDGLEWNLKVTSKEISHIALIAKVLFHFFNDIINRWAYQGVLTVAIGPCSKS